MLKHTLGTTLGVLALISAGCMSSNTQSSSNQSTVSTLDSLLKRGFNSEVQHMKFRFLQMISALPGME